MGNTHSADYQAHTHTGRGATAGDKFSVRTWEPQRKQDYASQLVGSLVAGAGSRAVVGDVSWVHTQYGRELLLADDRVNLVFQHREDLDAWFQSVLRQKPTPGLPETHIQKGCGISAKVRSVRIGLLVFGFHICTGLAARVFGPRWHMGGRVGSLDRFPAVAFVPSVVELISSCSQTPHPRKDGNRETRLKLYATKTLTEAHQLKLEFPGRVHIVSLEQLSHWAGGFFQRLHSAVLERPPSMGTPPAYDPYLARNSGSREQVLRAKRA